MATPLSEEMRDFHQFLGNKLHNGDVWQSPEEALDEWRGLHPEQSSDDFTAIRDVLRDLDQGERGILFDEFDREFRKRHQIPALP